MTRTAKNRSEAWRIADELFPSDYIHDSRRSKAAGYDIYYSTLPGCDAWISDLGSSLEVNMPDGDTIRVWITEESEEEINERIESEAEQALVEEAAAEIAEMVEAAHTVKRMTFEANYAPEVCQKVNICVMGATWSSADEKRIYEALKRGDPNMPGDILARWAETHGIKWGSIFGARAYHYDHHNGGGHFVVEGYISARIGEELGFLASCAALLHEEHEAHREDSEII